MAMFRWPGGFFGVHPMLRGMQREFDRMFGRGLFGEWDRLGAAGYPPVNVFNGPDDVVVQCEVAGVDRGDLNLSLTGETLEIKGAKKPPADEEKVRYHVRERGAGEFVRTIVLPDRVDAEKIDATLCDGLLTVRLPKAEAAKPKQIELK